jgi:hypothetical protein
MRFSDPVASSSPSTRTASQQHIDSNATRTRREGDAAHVHVRLARRARDLEPMQLRACVGVEQTRHLRTACSAQGCEGETGAHLFAHTCGDVLPIR